jgi:hypothetical protein
VNAPSLPGSKWLLWVHNLPLRVGVLTGVYLTAIMVLSVLAANRAPFLEEFAGVRNAVSYAAFGLVMLVPAGIFLRKPLELLFSSMVAWTLFSLAYRVMGFFFENLHVRLRGPLNVFMLGAVTYGVLVAAAWVASMALEARAQPVIASRRRH